MGDELWLFGGYWWGGPGHFRWFGGGLIGLLFTHRYPRDIFELVLGMNRWSSASSPTRR